MAWAQICLFLSVKEVKIMLGKEKGMTTFGYHGTIKTRVRQVCCPLHYHFNYTCKMKEK